MTSSETELAVIGGEDVVAAGCWPWRGLVFALALLLACGGLGIAQQGPADQGTSLAILSAIALPFAAFVAFYLRRAWSGSPSIVAGPRGVRIHGLTLAPRLHAWSEVEAIELQPSGNPFFSPPPALLFKVVVEGRALAQTPRATFVAREGLDELLQRLESLRAGARPT